MNQLTRITPLDTLKAGIARFGDREKLMLIDWIAEQLSSEVGGELDAGLSCAFERAEEGFSGTFTPLYPTGGSTVAWREYRAGRDRTLGHFLRGMGQ